MNDLSRYLKLIVEPTFEEFTRNPNSIRHGYLACLATYHAIDRVAFPKKPGNLLGQWRNESFEFMLIEVVANHIKHVESDTEKAERKNPPEGAIPLSFVLGFGAEGDELELRNLHFVVRDAIKFLWTKAALD